MTHGWYVEAVEPDHRLVRRVAVIVPLPTRRQHQIERAHQCLLAINGGKGAFAFKHEAERVLSMPVTGRNLAGQDQLQTGVKAGRNG